MERLTDEVWEFLGAFHALRSMWELGVSPDQVESLIRSRSHERRPSEGLGEWELTSATPNGAPFTAFYDHPWRERHDAVFVLALSAR